MEPISSLQNEKVKLAHGLQTRARTRRKERRIVLEGARLIQDALERGKKPEFVFYEAQTAPYDLIAVLQEKRIQPIPVTAEVMRHLSDTQQPAGILAVFPMPIPPLPRSPRRVLILDAIREPGNMGTILRTAAAAGVDVVLLSPGCADPYNPKALRGGMGAHFRIPVIEAPWEQIAGYCENLVVYLADSRGEQPYNLADWGKPWALIVGSEAHGAGSMAASIAQQRVTIPMAAETESINAAVAAGILLFAASHRP